MNLTEQELTEGIVGVIKKMCPDKEDDSSFIYAVRKAPNYLFEASKDDMISACVEVVRHAYIAKGSVEEAQAHLDSAKSSMKLLSEDYSDYEHYPNLKKYYATTSSFFDFCQNPTGSFEDAKSTINDYKNDIRDFQNDLNYVFEEEE